MALIFAAFFVAAGIYLPFIPVWLESRGLSVGEIALVLAAPLVLRTFIAPWLTYVIDSRFSRQTALVVISLLAAGLVGLLALSTTVATIALLFVLMGLCGGALLPLSDASAQRVAQIHGADYGRMRLWGSIAFMLTTIAGGSIIGAFGISSALTVIALAYLALAGVALFAPLPARADAPGSLPSPINGPSVIKILARPAFVGVLIIAALIQASHAVNYSFASLHWQRLGYTPFLIGMLWATGVMAEVLLFARSKPLLATTGPRRLLLLAAIGAIVRWLLLAYDPPLAIAFLAQTLHAMSFGLTHLATVTFISRTVKVELNATAQSAFYAMSGAVLALATLASGPLFDQFAAKAYLAMAGLAVAAAIGLAIIRRMVPDLKQSAP